MGTGGLNKGKIVLDDAGQMVQTICNEIPPYYGGIDIDAFQIMPNHVHGIINIFKNNDAGIQNVVGIQNFESLRVNKYQHIIPRSVGSIIRGFKSGVTKWFRNNTDIYIVWQKNYYEGIIRNENELNEIRKYIVNNPVNWETDKENI